MDEYTFIVMAKLKADRLKLKREERAAQRAQNDSEAEPIDRYHRSAGNVSSAREPEWREQS